MVTGVQTCALPIYILVFDALINIFFIDIAHSPKNILIRASKTNISREKKEKALLEVTALMKKFNLNPTLFNLLKSDELI